MWSSQYLDPFVLFLICFFEFIENPKIAHQGLLDFFFSLFWNQGHTYSLGYLSTQILPEKNNLMDCPSTPFCSAIASISRPFCIFLDSVLGYRINYRKPEKLSNDPKNHTPGVFWNEGHTSSLGYPPKL